MKKIDAILKLKSNPAFSTDFDIFISTDESCLKRSMFYKLCGMADFAFFQGIITIEENAAITDILHSLWLGVKIEELGGEHVEKLYR